MNIECMCERRRSRKMKIARVKNFDIANGKGIGVSVYVSGCRFHCPGCFNQEAWDFSYGTEYDGKTLEDIMQKLSSPHTGFRTRRYGCGPDTTRTS